MPTKKIDKDKELQGCTRVFVQIARPPSASDIVDKVAGLDDYQMQGACKGCTSSGCESGMASFKHAATEKVLPTSKPKTGFLVGLKRRLGF